MMLQHSTSITASCVGQRNSQRYLEKWLCEKIEWSHFKPYTVETRYLEPHFIECITSLSSGPDLLLNINTYTFANISRIRDKQTLRYIEPWTGSQTWISSQLSFNFDYDLLSLPIALNHCYLRCTVTSLIRVRIHWPRVRIQIYSEFDICLHDAHVRRCFRQCTHARNRPLSLGATSECCNHLALPPLMNVELIHVGLMVALSYECIGCHLIIYNNLLRLIYLNVSIYRTSCSWSTCVWIWLKKSDIHVHRMISFV